MKKVIEKENKEYWDAFYSKQRLSNPSTFFEFVKTYNFNVDQVIDVGCGNGRDTQAFRLNNYNVLGLDRSESAISINKENAIDSNEQYLCVDVSNQENLNTAFANKKGSLLVYSRFFLHSIDEKIQDTLLMFLKNNLKKNDILALEFRTKEDEEIDKIFGDHYRRYIDAEKFLEQLEKEYHFEINYYIKSRGLSVFKSEDPYLARIIAIKK